MTDYVYILDHPEPTPNEKFWIVKDGEITECDRQEYLDNFEQDGTDDGDIEDFQPDDWRGYEPSENEYEAGRQRHFDDVIDYETSHWD